MLLPLLLILVGSIGTFCILWTCTMTVPTMHFIISRSSFSTMKLKQRSVFHFVLFLCLSVYLCTSKLEEAVLCRDVNFREFYFSIREISFMGTRRYSTDFSISAAAGRRHLCCCVNAPETGTAQRHRRLPTGMHLMLLAPGSGGDIHAMCRVACCVEERMLTSVTGWCQDIHERSTKHILSVFFLAAMVLFAKLAVHFPAA